MYSSSVNLLLWFSMPFSSMTSNIFISPMTFLRFLISFVSIIFGYIWIFWFLFPLNSSKAPHIISDSNAFLLQPALFNLTTASTKLTKGPLFSLSSIIAWEIFAPTFFKAAKPIRIFSPSTVYSSNDLLISTGNIFIPLSSTAPTYFANLSLSNIIELHMLVKNSTL